MKRTLAIFFALLVLTGKIYAQDFSELEKAIAEEMKEKNAVGAAVAVIKGDKTIYSKGFGAANLETNAPVTADSLFQVGSITKTFTAALILSLAEEGKLKLDRPVGDYAKNLSPKLAKVNLSQLLSHTAGIIDEPDEFGTANEDSMATYVRSWKDDYALFDPNEVFSYSNSGFALAGFAAQETVGKSFVDLMTEKIFAPLKMRSATFRPTVAMTYPLAVGHQTKRGEKPQIVRPLPQDARLYPAGTFYASLNDLARFAVAFLNGGKIDGEQIVQPAVFEKMSAPRVSQPSAADDSGYGYGLFMNTAGGVRRVWHGGAMTGYTASMVFVPERKIGVIVLSNTNNVVFSKTQDKALKLMNAPAFAAKSATKPQTPLPLTAAEMQNLSGTYRQPKRFEIEIVTKGGKLYIREFGQEMLLNKIAENRFSFQFPNAEEPVEICIQPAGNGKSGFLHQSVWAFKKM